MSDRDTDDRSDALEPSGPTPSRPSIDLDVRVPDAHREAFEQVQTICETFADQVGDHGADGLSDDAFMQMLGDSSDTLERSGVPRAQRPQYIMVALRYAFYQNAIDSLDEIEHQINLMFSL